MISVAVEAGTIVAPNQILVIGERAIVIRMINALDRDLFADSKIVLTRKKVYRVDFTA